MLKKLKLLAKAISVLVGIVLLTSLSIDAADTISGSHTTLLASLFSVQNHSLCPVGMLELKTSNSQFCVDEFEASVGSACPFQAPSSDRDSASNILSPECKAESKSGVLPWSFITFAQAQQVCALSGKQLLSSSVWYQAALGTVDNSDCNTSGALLATGDERNCRSGIGAFDMVGNVWEFVVKDNLTNENSLLKDGYVAAVDETGTPTLTGTEPSDIYQSDYFWSSKDPNDVLIRGGYYGGGSDSGIYSVHADIGVNFSGGAVGFRCMIVK